MKKTILIIIGFVLVAGLSGGGVWYWQKGEWNKERSKLEKEIEDLKYDLSKQKTEEKVTEKTPTLDCGVAKQYTSEKMGVAFCYPEYLWDRKISVFEEGNIVYIDSKDGKGGQHVEVFEKKPEDDLKTAIEKEFLTNISKDICWVEMAEPGVLSPSLYKNPDHNICKTNYV
uniref:Uncharacterized protein n=1 Tax=candidate division CPR3 bacterium TaxID=2268181 RepID=A0A7C4R5R6_UNCC3